MALVFSACLKFLQKISNSIFAELKAECNFHCYTKHALAILKKKLQNIWITMPHFVIHCSENILSLRTEEEILRLVHDTADTTGLFKKGDIKVRILSFKNFTIGDSKSDFIHVFGNIMEGRTTEQKADL